MRFLAVIFSIVLLASSCRYKIDPEELASLLEKNKSEWNISAIDYRWKEHNYFGQTIHDCVSVLNESEVDKINTYLLKYANGKDVVVEVIQFDKTANVDIVYEKAMMYAQKIRSTPRKEYGSLCQPIREWDFHYV